MIPLPETGLTRVAVVALLATLAHLVIRGVRAGSDRLLAGGDGGAEAAARRYPKITTVVILLTSAATFVVWFVAIGMILRALSPALDLRTYFATATVIGLAVGFGSQGLVQDLVIGLTLIFTDVMNVGDTVELSGQVGRVQRIGLRFTTLTNFLGQTVYVPNRNIAVVGRYRRGVIRAYVDVQVPPEVAPEDVVALLDRTARGMRAQHPAAIVSDPDVLGHSEAEPGGWRYVRVKFRLWPGQQPLIETAFRQRVAATMKSLDPGYADWMVTVTYRIT